MKNKPKDTRPFLEKYPKLNLLIGFLLIAIFLLSILGLGIWVGKSLADIISWLAGMVSKLDAVIIVALITGTLSLIGVIINSVVSKIIDHKKSRQEYLAQKREESYGQFVDMVYKIQKNGKEPGSYGEKEMIEDLSRFSKEITLWGSPKVVEKWVEFRECKVDPNGPPENLLILEEIMNEMRKDLGLKKVKKGNLLAFFINDIKDAIKKSKK